MAEMEIKAQPNFTMINEYGNWHVMMKDFYNKWQAKLISARPENCLCRMDFASQRLYFKGKIHISKWSGRRNG